MFQHSWERGVLSKCMLRKLASDGHHGLRRAPAWRRHATRRRGHTWRRGHTRWWGHTRRHAGCRRGRLAGHSCSRDRRTRARQGDGWPGRCHRRRHGCGRRDDKVWRRADDAGRQRRRRCNGWRHERRQRRRGRAKRPGGVEARRAGADLGVKAALLALAVVGGVAGLAQRARLVEAGRTDTAAIGGCLVRGVQQAVAAQLGDRDAEW